MRKLLFVLLPGVFVFLGFNLQSQEAQEVLTFRGNAARDFTASFEEPYFRNGRSQTKSSNIKNMQVFGEKSGIAFTDDALFKTDDNGETWRETALPREFNEKIAAVYFLNENAGWVILADARNFRLTLAKTPDGGNFWSRTAFNPPPEDLPDINFDGFEQFTVAPDEKSARIRISLAASSNFRRTVDYLIRDGGQSWQAFSRTDEKGRADQENQPSLKRLSDPGSLNKDYRIEGDYPDETVIKSEVDEDGPGGSTKHSTWYLTQNGKCEGFKTGCWQATGLYKNQSRVENGITVLSVKEITPPQIRESARIEKDRAKLEAENSVFARPPNGTTRISLNRGFDKCTAATAAQMQTWWDNSPFYDVNIYLSGRNRGCTQAQLTAAWVNSVTAQGWGLIPTVVGYQSPCSVCTSCQKHSSDPAEAEQQGRGEADIAIADANNLGLTQGTILYYDMERYDDVSGTGACSTPTKAFLKGWTDRLKQLGYVSGVYGSPFNANGDWINIPPASQPDVVWLARWNSVMSVWGVAPLPDTFWTNHQRIHQWLGPRNETWGGVTFNIDNNISDAPVAGLAVAKNKRADFDGDGRSDLSVFRPETGVWYVWNSADSSYSILNFGIASDLLAPGDYDGDGKTDFAVWRPADGIWHLYSRSLYRSFAFGQAGDIPAPGDYDGDGRTDPAVFRPETGVWYIWNSFDSRGASYTIRQFGLAGDRPVPGDYDGDGKTDIAVYRPSEGIWYLLQSTAGFAAARWGVASDWPVAADYDGDGRDDLAVFRDGTWYLLQSQAGIFVTRFGAAGDKPAVGDYDGDNRADLGVYRPSEGIWYIFRSQSGVLITQFGLAADSPVPTAYTP